MILSITLGLPEEPSKNVLIERVYHPRMAIQVQEYLHVINITTSRLYNFRQNS